MPGPAPSRRPLLTLRRADQAAAAGCLALGLTLLAAHWVYQGQLRGRLIEIEAASPLAAEFQLDINQADWPEWTLLPDVGEQLARRIVEDRDSRGPFRDHNDLRRVRGVGPKTMENIRPYLLPLPDNENVAGK